MRNLSILAGLTMGLIACSRPKAALHESAVASPSPVATLPPKGAPRSQADLPTTDGEIAAGNLSAQLEAREKMLATQPNLNPLHLAAHAQLLLEHGRVFG